MSLLYRSALAVGRKLAAGAWPLLAGMGAAQAEPVLKYPEIEYASPEQSIWTTRVNDRGEPENPLFQLASELFARAGIPWHGRTYPATRMFKYLEEGTAQFSMLVHAPVLQRCCLLSKKPVASAEIRIYRSGQRPAVRSREELAGKAVITVRGYSYAGLKDFIADGMNRVADNEAPSHGSAFRMLASGRADYLIDYGGPAAEVLAENPIPGIQYDVLSRQDIHLVLSRTYPEAEKVMARLEAIAEALEREKPKR